MNLRRNAVMLFLICGPVCAADLHYKDHLPGDLVKQVPGILKAFDAETGHFGTGIWICTDQNRMYPLAVAYGHKSDANPYFKDRKLLDVIMKAGDALIEDMDERGQWVFRKKDGSTWGKIWMPWTYSRWVRSFALIHDDMPPARREAWIKALTLGYTGIARSQLRHVHNIPAHHAMGLYAAGKVLDRPAWCTQAADFMMKVAGQQAEGGYWSENIGPVVGYNFVYLDALGTYYAMSGDRRVLPALEKGAGFHRMFVYPNGHRVETVDERNPYHKGVDPGNVGFTFTATGRAYLQTQWERYGASNLPADLIASLLLYGEEGPIAETPADKSARVSVLTEGGADRALTLREGPWFACLSAYTAPIPTSRWIQDRQNLVSIYHDRTGLILGGGNTKLQPAWSNFTIGDMTLLQHRKGDTSPNFLPRGALHHVPSAATLVREPNVGLDLTYGAETCYIRLRAKDDRTFEYRIESTVSAGLPVAAHLTLIPHLGQSLETNAGRKITLGEAAVILSGEELDGGLTHAGYRLHLPKSATLHWPALPHNPYRKDGRATAAEGRIEIRIPFDANAKSHIVTIEILE